VGVIYTTRYVIGHYDDYYVPALSVIPERLKQCASDGYYFAAKDGDQIKTALRELFSKASREAMARLTE
jgi:hypothetical protein